LLSASRRCHWPMTVYRRSSIVVDIAPVPFRF
jgi:hypothetical protein